MNEGHSYAWDQEWSKAAAAYRNALQEFPDHPKALNSLGLALFQQGNYEEALEIYKRVAQVSPQDAIAMEKLAQLLERTGQPRKNRRTRQQGASSHARKRRGKTSTDPPARRPTPPQTPAPQRRDRSHRHGAGQTTGQTQRNRFRPGPGSRSPPKSPYASGGDSLRLLQRRERRRAARGETLFDQAQLNRAARWREETNKLNQLTPREREILELIKQGLDNNAIAQALNVSVKTAMYHTTNLFRKLQVKHRQEAALWALKYLPDNPDISPG
jgi:ATP/maltotriose-dependent transcriptional regulator MalT